MIFLFFTLLAVFFQGIFALFEMAALSFHQIRLQYYASIGNKKARWLWDLLQKPSYFFGTTLIGINAAIQIGSECSRKFYESIHLDPDLAPITQVFLVVIFGELSPMFAARRHPSQIALKLVPLMKVISLCLFPFIWIFDLLSQTIHRFVGSSKEGPTFFSREEVAMAFREGEEDRDEFHILTDKIFHLKLQTANQLMTPLDQIPLFASSTKIGQVRENLSLQYHSIIPIYRHQKEHIIAIVHVRDLLRCKPEQSIFEPSRSPWFVTKETSILEILNQFRRNNQKMAIILDHSGTACGVLTLDKIISDIFGNQPPLPSSDEELPRVYIERTFEGTMTVDAFNQEFQCHLEHQEEDTLSDLMIRALDHPPVSGETVRIGSFTFTVLEPTLRGVGKLSVRSHKP
jgi:putative hemolysin